MNKTGKIRIGYDIDKGVGYWEWYKLGKNGNMLNKRTGIATMLVAMTRQCSNIA
jgi:hypothetical protein